ncbi:hypothetical protein SmJEL517_g05569 [Synchytrium microbalum]|uniref:Vacuolar transporter chaperone complex subunit 4 n=1 Tax=Synchytrium microbalum TaxID=1806994 RepID=A0A507BNG3_9FUNG|nr:uncharacterized protein SmJEL517_g05569 [Synchytrium microbalum]TPX31027.1 hypothetical protein SmJEL517_g05569 [Synchytrium microbalum]
MKFGVLLDDHLFPEWRFYYMDYNELKRQLKVRTASSTDGKFTEQDEAAFVEICERELEKVASFRTLKSDELERRVAHAQAAIDSILSSGGKPDDNRMKAVEDELNKIATEMTELSKFVRLNYTGFMKILKKHDKHAGYQLKPTFMVRLAHRPFYKEGDKSVDSIVIRLSRLFDIVRTGGVRAPTTPPGGASQNFIRHTTKYWVHPDNITEVKLIILKYLPVLLFSSKGGKEPDPAITSIYFDNDAFELYLGRLEKTEGAEAIRIRWYGNMDQQEIFVERKTHREDWTGESSVKSRFSIKEKYVNAFLDGTHTLDKTIAKARERKQKSEKELDEMATLSAEIQSSVVKRKLHPMVRTFYNRTAFQLPGDARVRISLDTDLTMIREDNYGKPRSGDNWRRMDIGTTPSSFDHLPEEDMVRFPYAVLEVKLQTLAGNEAPKWVTELINSHLVEEVPKFSKFIHGVATLLESRVTMLPFWLPQMDKDIRKDAPRRPPSALDFPASTKRRISAPQGVEVVVERPATSSASTSRPNGQVTERTPLLAVHDEEEEYEEDQHRTRKGVKPAFSWSNLFASGQAGSGQMGHPNNGFITSMVSTMNSSRGPQQQKRIVLPVRVEPKVFFANERTFLSWLHFCIVLGGLALGLLNFGDSVGQISGLIFTVVAMIFMIYALFLYQWRAHKIRNRDAAPYDDRFGPTVLVLVLFLAVMTNFYLKFSEISP